MTYLDTVEVNKNQKIVSRVFILVILFFAVLSVVFAILTVVCNIRLQQADYSSYFSYSSQLSCNRVYASTEYKVSNKITLFNHAREKMLVDMVFTYVEPDGDMFTERKSVNVNMSESQSIYVYFYRPTTVKLVSISYKVSFMSEYVTMYADDLYDILYEGQTIWTMGRVMQSIMFMAVCLLLMTLSIILFVITKQMFRNNYIKSIQRKGRLHS